MHHMYQAYWGLQTPPFSTALDVRSFYPSQTYNEALARLQFLVDAGRRAGLLLGPPGCGKSLLLEVLAGQLRRVGRSVSKLSLLGVDVHELLWTLAADWGQSPEATASEFALWRVVGDTLESHRFQHIDTVILLDDADEATPEVLSAVARLAQSEPTAVARLTLVLASSTARVKNLGRRLLELADLRIDIVPWDAAETERYIDHALAQAGRTAPVFAAGAIARLAELAEGVPRHVNQLADLTLLAAAAQKLETIDAHTVDAVCDELALINPVGAL
jgi:type II secretory pathway predicted ATPase ExeA